MPLLAPLKHCPGRESGDGLRFGPDGSLIGLTILNVRLRLEEDGEIAITLPEKRVVARDLGDAFAHV